MSTAQVLGMIICALVGILIGCASWSYEKFKRFKAEIDDYKHQCIRQEAKIQDSRTYELSLRQDIKKLEATIEKKDRKIEELKASLEDANKPKSINIIRTTKPISRLTGWFDIPREVVKNNELSDYEIDKIERGIEENMLCSFRNVMLRNADFEVDRDDLHGDYRVLYSVPYIENCAECVDTSSKNPIMDFVFKIVNERNGRL